MERLHPPGDDVAARHVVGDGERGDCRLGPVRDGECRLVGGQHPLQRLDGRPRLGELRAHPVEVVDDHGVARLLVRRVEEGAQALDRQVEVAEPPDHLGGGDLGHVVGAVAGGVVDAGGRQQSGLVVVTQRLHRQERHPRELPDAEQLGVWGHAHIPHSPPRGGSTR